MIIERDTVKVYKTKTITIQASDGVKTLPAFECRRGVQIKGKSDNTSPAFFLEDSKADGFPVDKSESLFLPVENANLISYKTADAGAQTFYLIML